MLQYDINDDELINERNYNSSTEYNVGSNRGQVSHHPYHHRHLDENDILMHERERERERYPPSNQPPQLSRREREEYSPHRGGGNGRRVLNAM